MPTFFVKARMQKIFKVEAESLDDAVKIVKSCNLTEHIQVLAATAPLASSNNTIVNLPVGPSSTGELVSITEEGGEDGSDS